MTYECHNPACPLGTPHDRGRFSGGITAEHATNLTGDPDAPHGDGICPNCGEAGVPVEED